MRQMFSSPREANAIYTVVALFAVNTNVSKCMGSWSVPDSLKLVFLDDKKTPKPIDRQRQKSGMNRTEYAVVRPKGVQCVIDSGGSQKSERGIQIHGNQCPQAFPTPNL